ncbi:MAG: T9SS type A sorting domain-containing protein, partial [Bacteroidota bacterium]
LTVGPGNTAWGGNNRINVGGFGARPLNYNGNTRLFMGGGGGSGDGNNSAAGFGGNGAGIVYIFSVGDVSGTGSITANGQGGFNTQGANIDGAGGAGAGGAIVLTSKGSITGITLQANGGKGGDQLTLSGEAEGPGGGGSGGYIGTTSTSVSRQVNGGDNGVSYSAMVTEFLPNGATQGAAGTIAGKTFTDVAACTSLGFVLPIKLYSFDAVLQDSKVALNWVTESEINSNHFELERSLDGQTFSKIANIFTKGNATQKMSYDYNDNINSITKDVVYYRLKMVDADNKFSYSDIRVIRIGQQTASNKLITYPNPSTSDLHVLIPTEWQGKKVRFELFDVAGRKTKQIDSNSASQAESINIKDLDAGFYVVRASMGTETAQQRIIKK